VTSTCSGLPEAAQVVRPTFSGEELRFPMLQRAQTIRTQAHENLKRNFRFRSKIHISLRATISRLLGHSNDLLDNRSKW